MSTKQKQKYYHFHINEELLLAMVTRMVLEYKDEGITPKVIDELLGSACTLS